MIDLDTIEAKIHDEPSGPLTGIALALVAEVRRLRAGLNDVRQMLIEAGAEEAARMVEEPAPLPDEGMVFRPLPGAPEGERDLPVKG